MAFTTTNEKLMNIISKGVQKVSQVNNDPSIATKYFNNKVSAINLGGNNANTGSTGLTGASGTKTSGSGGRSSAAATAVNTGAASTPAYTPAQSVTNLFSRLSAGLNDPATYSYGRQQELDDMYSRIMNRPDFKFDLAGDTLYRQYADQYQNLGKQASLDTMGQAAALTGGYGNSYGASAANQAYQQYLGQLNDKVMDVYDRQHQHYEDTVNDDYQKYSMLLNDRDTDYGMYRDRLSDLQTAASQAQQYVSTLLAQGQMPPADMLAIVGLSPETARMLMAQPKAVASSGGGTQYPVDDGTGDQSYNGFLTNLIKNNQLGNGTVNQDTEEKAKKLAYTDWSKYIGK